MLHGVPRLLLGVIWTMIMRSAVTKFKNRRFYWAYWTKYAAIILINNHPFPLPFCQAYASSSRGLAQHINVDQTVKIWKAAFQGFGSKVCLYLYTRWIEKHRIFVSKGPIYSWIEMGTLCALCSWFRHNEMQFTEWDCRREFCHPPYYVDRESVL